MLQAAEEAQNTAAAAPSKAAEKRARRKAAAREAAATAAAAAAAPLPAADLPEHGQPDGNDASAVAGAAAELQYMSLGNSAAVQSAPTAGSTSAAAAPAAGCGQQQLQQPPAWMLCPITKVGSAQALASVRSCPSRWLETDVMRSVFRATLSDAGGDGAGNAVCWRRPQL